MVDISLPFFDIGGKCLNAIANAGPVAFDTQGPPIAPAAEILRGVPTFRWVISTEDFAIALGMRPSDTCIMLRVPNIELDLHGCLLGLIEISEQDSKRSLPPLITVQVKALSLHGRQNGTHRVGAQGIHIEI